MYIILIETNHVYLINQLLKIQHQFLCIIFKINETRVFQYKLILHKQKVQKRRQNICRFQVSTKWMMQETSSGTSNRRDAAKFAPILRRVPVSKRDRLKSGSCQLCLRCRELLWRSFWNHLRPECALAADNMQSQDILPRQPSCFSRCLQID